MLPNRLPALAAWLFAAGLLIPATALPADERPRGEVKQPQEIRPQERVLILNETPPRGSRVHSASGNPPAKSSRAATIHAKLEDASGRLTLEDLIELARENNPTLVQAKAAVDAAFGRQIQAGLYPNPTIGYTGSEIGNDGHGGQQGFVVGQEIVRGGKLRWSQTIAGYDRERAEAEAAAQGMRVLNSVQLLFFETLAAERTLELTHELVKLAEQGVAVAEQREKLGEGTLTEVIQAQIELEQVRALVSSSVNNFRATWKQMAAVIGKPEMEPAALAGSLETGREDRDELAAFAQIAGGSPELLAAEANFRRAEAALQRARVERVPNATIEAGTQYDYGSNTQIANVGISFPIPYFNKNQGNIVAAEAELLRARREMDRVRFSLAERFAVAFERYRNASQQVERYGRRLPEAEIPKILALKGDERKQAMAARPQILPRAQLALALATEGWQRGEFSYLHVLTAQRTLTQVSMSHVRLLAELRASVVAMDGFLLTHELAESRTLGLVRPGQADASNE